MHIHTHIWTCIYAHVSAKLFSGAARKDWKPLCEVCLKYGPRVLGPPGGKPGAHCCDPTVLSQEGGQTAGAEGELVNKRLADREQRDVHVLPEETGARN